MLWQRINVPSNSTSAGSHVVTTGVFDWIDFSPCLQTSTCNCSPLALVQSNSWTCPPCPDAELMLDKIDKLKSNSAAIHWGIRPIMRCWLSLRAMSSIGHAFQSVPLLETALRRHNVVRSYSWEGYCNHRIWWTVLAMPTKTNSHLTLPTFIPLPDAA